MNIKKQPRERERSSDLNLMARSIVGRAIGAPLIPKAGREQDMQPDDEGVKTWLKKAKVDLHYLSVRLEAHAKKGLAAKVAGHGKVAEHEQEVVEIYYRRTNEPRTVIADQESKLSQTKAT